MTLLPERLDDCVPADRSARVIDASIDSQRQLQPMIETVKTELELDNLEVLAMRLIPMVSSSSL